MASTLMPLRPAAGSVFTAVMTRSALMPFVMNVFDPFTTKWSPSRIAVVEMAPKSLPACGSVMAIAVTISPETPGSHALLFVGRQVEQVGEAYVVVRREAQRHAGYPAYINSSVMMAWYGSRARHRRRKRPVPTSRGSRRLLLS